MNKTLRPRALERCRQLARTWLRGLRLRLRHTLAAAAAALCAGLAQAAPVDSLTLLVPDGVDLQHWSIKVWVDSAAEEGLNIELMTDSQLLALGTGAARAVPGLIVPDSAHLRASDALIAAIKQYAYTGGKLMLVYDAGVLDTSGFFPTGGRPSRFADMVGLDYALWNDGAGAETMVGFGPVVGTRARLDSLSMPPGKYLPYQPPASLATTTASTAFVPVTAADPGGSARLRGLLQQRQMARIDEGSGNVRKRRLNQLRQQLGLGVELGAPVKFNRRNPQAFRARDRHIYDLLRRNSFEVDAVINADGRSATERSVNEGAAGDGSLQTISGYGYGALNYFSYVTTGTFPGTVYLSSPEHGLAAGIRAYGSGQLLFVNMPLGYFKAVGTDGALLHGFLDHFGRDVVGLPSMSVQPRGRGGLIYNWHIDDGDDLTADTKQLLAETSILKRGPFSLHFTAGPDVISFGDGKGQDLDNDKTAQDLVRKLGNVGPYASPLNRDRLPAHELGSHGGWVHDYWGANASEANVPDLSWMLQRNFDAIERITGRRITEYSSPQGNTPTWAVRWLEARGVKAMYMVSDLGAAMIRPWRNGQRLTDKAWSSPVTPLGKYATFEEFEEFGVSDMASGQWLLDLQSFAINHRTNRMFYTHPPGTLGHLQPFEALLNRADRMQASGRFRWYTMSHLADFSQRRVETEWSARMFFGLTTFTATNAQGLTEQTWLLPKSRYTMPVVVSGAGSVRADGKDWLVTAEGGTSLKFTTLRY
ncbi:MAG: hypothetical protein RL223_347 [Pseudomonadota bacterium]